MYYNVCNYTPSTWYAFQLLSEGKPFLTVISLFVCFSSCPGVLWLRPKVKISLAYSQVPPPSSGNVTEQYDWVAPPFSELPDPVSASQLGKYVVSSVRWEHLSFVSGCSSLDSCQTFKISFTSLTQIQKLFYGFSLSDMESSDSNDIFSFFLLIPAVVNL